MGLSNKITSSVLDAIGEVGGPRCCKRNFYLAIARAVEFAREHLGIKMETGKIECTHSSQNNQCIEKKMPILQQMITIVCKNDADEKKTRRHFNLYPVKQNSKRSGYYNQKYGRKGLLFPF